MILVAIGANLPGPDGAPPIETCRRAAMALHGVMPGLSLAALSRWWASPAWPAGSGAPDYVNGVARLAGPAPDPAALLAALLAIETRFGRARSEPNAPRTLDLDLLAIGGMVRAAPDPILPHPRLHLRAFVLAPLLEVAPGFVLPGQGGTGHAWLARADRDGLRPI
jgi:2-amino-4-hydroxy-6-hydroxymethyldihydropteridine diphosphokinase